MTKLKRADLARMLGVHRSRVTQMVSEGKLAIDSDGFVDMDASPALANIQTKLASKTTSQAATSQVIDYVRQYHEARAKLETIKAQRQELKYQQEQAEVVLASGVERAAFSTGRTIRDALLNLPKQFTDPAVRGVVEDTVTKLLTQLQEVLQ